MRQSPKVKLLTVCHVFLFYFLSAEIDQWAKKIEKWC